ncbi:MAG: sugar transferase [Acidobacteriota bacterium]
MSGFLPHSLRLWPALAALDGAALLGAVWLAHAVRFPGTARAHEWGRLLAHPGLIVVALAALWALAAASELYEPPVIRRRRELSVRVAVVAASWGAALALATYAVPGWRFGRGLLAITTLVWGLVAAGVRALLGQYLARRARPRALVIGEGEAVAEVCARLRHHSLAPWEPVEGAGISAAEVGAEARAQGAEAVVLAGRELGSAHSTTDFAALHFSGLPVVAASEVWAWLDGRLPLSELSPEAFFHQPGFGAVHWELFNRFTRVLDVAMGAVLAVLSAPLVLLAALAVWIGDGPPVLYRQLRVGRHGRAFALIKLRTMRRDAESNGPAFASPNDPRVTGIGRLLRRLRIDELPQLLNVLRGEMSLVGPRPERPEFVAELALTIPYYTFRLAVPPGLTGWAQVNLPYARTEDEHRRRLEYDLYFIRERSVGLYLITLLRTASAALVGVRR